VPKALDHLLPVCALTATCKQCFTEPLVHCLGADIILRERHHLVALPLCLWSLQPLLLLLLLRLQFLLGLLR
jgi:hypothetical protein